MWANTAFQKMVDRSGWEYADLDSLNQSLLTCVTIFKLNLLAKKKKKALFLHYSNSEKEPENL